jgi:hypothetical protein
VILDDELVTEGMRLKRREDNSRPHRSFALALP